jgi:hypothetical protein
LTGGSTPEVRWLVHNRDIGAAIRSVERDDYEDAVFARVRNRPEHPPPYYPRDDYEDALRQSVRGGTNKTTRPFDSRDDYRGAVVENIRGVADQRFDPREDYENTKHKRVRSKTAVTAPDPFAQLNRAAVLRRWWNMKRNCEGSIRTDILFQQQRLLIIGEPGRPGADPDWIPLRTARYHDFDPNRPDVLLLNRKPAYFNLQAVFREEWAAAAVPSLRTIIDIASEAPHLSRYSDGGPYRRATPDEIDECLAALAKLDGGQTNRNVIRDWGRHWLRNYKQADVTATILRERFNSPKHEGIRRPAGTSRSTD